MSNVAAIGDGQQMSGSDWLAPDCQGLNFFEIDRGLQGLLKLYLADDLREHMTPHYQRLGEIAGGRLDELSRLADRHDPILHTRDHYGNDQDWIEFHPAYREMEQIGYHDFGIHCMSRKPGVLGWPDKVPSIAKYVFQYLFVQSEFGLMCPISATDTSAMLIERYGDEATKQKLLAGMLSQDKDKILKGAQFMTEKAGGSDVGNLELEARNEDGVWRLYGEKWFCSCADGDVAILLARPEGAPGGSRGLGLFALPRHLEDGSRNPYRIVRLKDKLGTRSMASGEIIFEGAVAYPLGEVGAGPNKGLKQMMDQVNMSRLSHGVRAAAMMRRCLNESLVVAQNRIAFGERIIEKPLLRRQLMKLMVPTEQVLSVVMYVARNLTDAEAGDARAERLTRILTPLLKFRSCRDNITVANGAMEVRGGNGFIEDWINPKLVRDALTGVLWEGTSNINALDVTTRAVAKIGAHEDLGTALCEDVNDTSAIPGQFRGELTNTVERAVAFADEVAKSGNEPMARQASDALYHATSAALLATEGARLGEMGEDASRLILSRMVVDHRLRPHDPLAIGDDDAASVAALLSDEPVDLATAQALTTA
ncbi:MAG: acyl-CoA dehydrogenase family protein [Alphaproteobacteria bacterium]|nr:acyl-CoA dehydrogenase family protein [Alphaproteobacteria bacterium]MDP6567417.1 acyl-CoA dehydrogenase family protein [Alphaproteobacteria bacterium]MDP6814351.1 acyl-CoA dehydrogenase family protein [Alphaproteobacteria bacterium]